MQLMKRKTFLLALFTVFATIVPRLTAAPGAKDSYYFILVTDGVHKNKTGIASRPIYYPGYSVCRLSSSQFLHAARQAFAKHVAANYEDSFEYTHNLRPIEMKQHSTTSLLRTAEQANQRLVEWVAEQKQKGYRAEVQRRFSFSSANL